MRAARSYFPYYNVTLTFQGDGNSTGPNGANIAAVRLLLAGAAALVGVPRVQLRPRHARHRQRHDRSLARDEPAALSVAARRMMLLSTVALGVLSGHAHKFVSQLPGAF